MLQRLINKIRPDSFTTDRNALSRHYISGTGIEIGALHYPLPVGKKAKVKYVDRMEQEELRRQYPELANMPLVRVDHIADGELLESIPDQTQDFVIANHFIEHCQNTILAIQNMLRVLKPGGIIFLAVPDKRYTFDKLRDITSIAHVVEDYRKGPQISRDQHFSEWVTALHPEKDEIFRAAEKQRLLGIDYSIHYHVWEKKDMDELLTYLIKEFAFEFEIELSLRRMHTNENIYILRKSGNPKPEARGRD